MMTNQALKDRINLEKNIFRKAVNALLEAGYELRVNDGEGWACERTTDKKKLFSSFFSTDEDVLVVYEAGKKERIGWVLFIYGNDGWDVISDYTTNLEDVLKPVNDYAEKKSMAS